jgi:DSBA-like thioredoxin domain
MDAAAFSVTYDYRCPFARNVHEHVVQALRDGAPWDVTFAPFSLTQAHVEEGGRPVWEDADKAGDLLAIECSIVVRERHPDRFLDFHVAMFGARHDQALDVRDPEVVRDVLIQVGVDADAVLEEVALGWPRDAFRKAHEVAVSDHHVFGVPTFVIGGRAAFVRIMTRPGDDSEVARATIEHVLSLLEDHPELNEFKYTTISR